MSFPNQTSCPHRALGAGNTKPLPPSDAVCSNDVCCAVGEYLHLLDWKNVPSSHHMAIAKIMLRLNCECYERLICDVVEQHKRTV